MMWLIKIICTWGEWYQCVVVADSEEEAVEFATAYAEAEGFELDEVYAQLFDQGTHGDIVDYEILN